MSNPPRSGTGFVPLVAGARLPLAFIAFGLVALAVATGWLARRPELLLLPFTHPAVVAFAHLWLPGFLLSVCVGALYQMMPVVLGVPLKLPLTAAWTHLAFHVMGIAGLVTGFASGNFMLVAGGGMIVTAGVVVLGVGTWRTFCCSARRDAIAWSLPLAAGWLAATAIAGVLMALNRRVPFVPLAVIDLLRAHAHLGLAGFFVTLLQGVTFQLLPMFTMGTLRRPRLVGAGLALVQLGLITLTPALALGSRAGSVAGALIVASGLGCSAIAFGSTLRTRRRRGLELALKAFTLGAAFLVTAAVGGLVLACLGGNFEAIMAYGASIVAGAFSLMVLGMLCKIVPFLVWMRIYGPRAGRQPVPAATALGSKRLETGWWVLHAVALAIVLSGIFLASRPIVAMGTMLLGVAVFVFLANITRVMSHLFRPQTPVVVAAPRSAPVSS